MKRRAPLFLGSLVALVGIGLIRQCHTGPVPAPPVEFKTLDPLVRQLITKELERVGRWRRFGNAWQRMGMVYEANGLFGDAALCYERALALEPGDAKTLHRLACVQERTGDLLLAADTMTLATRADESYPPSWWRLAVWRLDLGELDEASVALERAGELTPDDDAVHFGVVRLHLARKAADAAVATIQARGLLEGQDAAYAQHLLAIARRMQGDLEGAEEAQKSADGRKQQFSDPWGREMQSWRTGYATMRIKAGRDVKAGRFAEAERLLKAVLEYEPSDVRSLNMLAVSRLEQGDAGSALALLEQLLSIEPGHYGGTINYVRALLRERSIEPGALQAANVSLREAIAARPKNIDGWRMLAALEKRRARPEQLIEVLDQASMLDHSATDLRLKAAYEVLKLARFDDALERFRTLQREHPELTEAWFGEVLSLVHAQRAPDARRALEQLSSRPDADPERLLKLRQSVGSMR